MMYFRVYSSCQVSVSVTSCQWYFCVSGCISSILFQMSDISCQLLSSQLSVVRLSASIDIGSCLRYQLLLHIKSHWLLINKRIITRGTGVIGWWCMSCILEGLIMVPSCGFQPWGNQGSTGCLFSCQLSGLCPDYSATLVVFSCGAVVTVIKALWLILVQHQGC